MVTRWIKLIMQRVYIDKAQNKHSFLGEGVGLWQELELTLPEQGLEHLNVQPEPQSFPKNFRGTAAGKAFANHPRPLLLHLPSSDPASEFQGTGSDAERHP